MTAGSLPLTGRGRSSGELLLRPAARAHGRASLWLGVGILLCILLAALFAPLVARHSPRALDIGATLTPPSASHPFGTDQFGRDIFARVIYSARIDLVLIVSIVSTGFVVGSLVGIVAGWLGGTVDAIVTRVIDVALGFPFLVLVISVIGMRGPGLMSLYIAVSLVSWVYYARLVREEVRSARQADFMRAAYASDFRPARLVSRHLLPSVIVQPLLYASSDCVYALLLGASVSFLGLGVQPPRSEWGQMVAQGVPYVSTQWWMSTFPGLAIVLTAIAFSLLADGLAEVIRTGRD